MEGKSTKLQKIILIYLKPMVLKQTKKYKYIKRVELTKKLKIVLDKQYNVSFNNILSQAIKCLVSKKLVSIRYNSIGLTESGMYEAIDTTNIFKSKYGVINSKNVQIFYRKNDIVMKENK